MTLDDRAMRDIRGNDISMIFQEPMTSLNPVLTVGRQIGETLRLHQGLDHKSAQARAAEMLNLVGISEPGRRLREYPHQLSGGMRQRVMIAMALACNPKLLIADEPTTALDVTIQAQILDLMADLKRRIGAAIILITHDLGVVAEIAERVMVMYAGRKVEEAPVADAVSRPAASLYAGPARRGAEARFLAHRRRNQARRDSGHRAQPQAAHRRLRVCRPLPARHRAVPASGAGARAQSARPPRGLPLCRGGYGGGMSALLEVNDLKKHFSLGRGLWGAGGTVVYAVDGVSFHIEKGETLALVGESGCGKSTVGRAILRLFEITAGQVVLDGRRIDDLPAGTLRPLRRRMQVVFQDPFSSLNPRMRVRDILAEPIRNFGLASSPADLNARIDALLDTVRLPREAARRWPHEFSGGQRQRIGIARALAAEPDLIVCDEAVSALDVSVKAQIVNLLQDLQRELGLAMLFISHDLAIVEHMTHRVAVMYLGKIVETAPKRQIFAAPKHPYTQGAAVGRSGADAGGRAPADHPQRRRAEREQAAQRLPLSHPLPLCVRPLQGGGAGVAADRCRAVRRLPPARPAGGAEPDGRRRRRIAQRARSRRHRTAMTALHDLSADTLSSAYRAGQRSPVEVTRAALARIDAWEGKINAMHVITADEALAQAASAEARWRAGTPLSALDGVPITIKDKIAVAGIPSPLGTAAGDMTPSASDAPPVARVREAGCDCQRSDRLHA